MVSLNVFPGKAGAMFMCWAWYRCWRRCAYHFVSSAVMLVLLRTGCSPDILTCFVYTSVFLPFSKSGPTSAVVVGWHVEIGTSFSWIFIVLGSFWFVPVLLTHRIRNGVVGILNWSSFFSTFLFLFVFDCSRQGRSRGRCELSLFSSVSR